MLFFPQNPAHPNQTMKMPFGPAAGDLIFGTLKLFSVFHFSISQYFNMLLLHVRTIYHRVFSHNPVSPGWKNTKPLTPLKCLKNVT